MTGDLDLTSNGENQVISLPWIFPVTQPAGAPTSGTENPPKTPGTESPPKHSQSTMGTCPHPACTYVDFSRRQEWERHVLQHLPHFICCPYPDCNWSGNRRGYPLMDHYPQDQVPDRVTSHDSEFTIYDTKPLARWLLNREVTLEEAIDDANAMVREKAVELGKWDMWNVQPPSVRERVLGQLPHHICCPHPCCIWRGSRHYALIKHWEEEHPLDQRLDRGPLDAFTTIYNARQLAGRLIGGEVTLKQAIDEAEASVRKKAVELGKWDMWDVTRPGQTDHSEINLGLNLV
ncbi:hypothetical protein EDB84DRAFT_1563669 [Lactarius hengduanensis]|nr:hypothetical protein EDB84DRAFT_1563669 [Lactarius hengduanensis]